MWTDKDIDTVNYWAALDRSPEFILRELSEFSSEAPPYLSELADYIKRNADVIASVRAALRRRELDLRVDKEDFDGVLTASPGAGGEVEAVRIVPPSLEWASVPPPVAPTPWNSEDVEDVDDDDLEPDSDLPTDFMAELFSDDSDSGAVLCVRQITATEVQFVGNQCLSVDSLVAIIKALKD